MCVLYRVLVGAVRAILSHRAGKQLLTLAHVRYFRFLPVFGRSVVRSDEIRDNFESRPLARSAVAYQSMDVAALKGLGVLVKSWLGATYNLAGNIGMPFTDDGFINLSFEYGAADETNRSVQRNDAQEIIDAPTICQSTEVVSN